MRQMGLQRLGPGSAQPRFCATASAGMTGWQLRRGFAMADPNARPPFRQHPYYHVAVRILVLLVADYFAARFLGNL